MLADQRPVILWLNAILIGLTLGAICSRAGRRIFVVGKFGWHDVMITIAAISGTVFSICQMVGTTLGLGLHRDRVSDDNLENMVKLVLASNSFYFLCNWAVKHALLLFYSEITRERKHLWSIYFMHFVAFGFGISSIFVNLFQCDPFSKAWDSDASGTCVRMDIFFYYNASMMLATDMVLYAMPVIFTRKLQLRRPQRIGLNCLFALGGLVLAVSGVRVWAVHMFNTHDDFPYWFANIMIWSVLENHVAVVVACAPSMKVAALLIFPRMFSSVGKIMSKVAPSTSRSRSRSRGSSIPYLSGDLETGATRKSDKSQSTPSMPSPALFREDIGREREPRNFSRWFRRSSLGRGLESPRLHRGGEADSMENGLMYVEDTPLQDITVSHTITVHRD